MNGPVVVGYLLAIAAGAWAVYLAWRRDAPEPVELDRCDECDDVLPGDGSAFAVWRGRPLAAPGAPPTPSPARRGAPCTSPARGAWPSRWRPAAAPGCRAIDGRRRTSTYPRGIA